MCAGGCGEPFEPAAISICSCQTHHFFLPFAFPAVSISTGQIEQQEKRATVGGMMLSCFESFCAAQPALGNGQTAKPSGSQENKNTSRASHTYCTAFLIVSVVCIHGESDTESGREPSVMVEMARRECAALFRRPVIQQRGKWGIATASTGPYQSF